MKRSKTLVYDVCLIAFAVATALVLFIIQTSEKRTGQWVCVSVDGNEIAKYSLYENAHYSLNGGTNNLVIENGYVFMENAECPDKLCVKQGKIKYNGQCITCLPNKLTVTVSGSNSNVDFVL